MKASMRLPAFMCRPMMWSSVPPDLGPDEGVRSVISGFTNLYFSALSPRYSLATWEGEVREYKHVCVSVRGQDEGWGMTGKWMVDGWLVMWRRVWERKRGKKVGTCEMFTLTNKFWKVKFYINGVEYIWMWQKDRCRWWTGSTQKKQQKVKILMKNHI